MPRFSSRLHTTGQRLQRGPLLQQRFFALTVLALGTAPSLGLPNEAPAPG